jgi:hypothetical protein
MAQKVEFSPVCPVRLTHYLEHMDYLFTDINVLLQQFWNTATTTSLGAAIWDLQPVEVL